MLKTWKRQRQDCPINNRGQDVPNPATLRQARGAPPRKQVIKFPPIHQFFHQVTHFLSIPISDAEQLARRFFSAREYAVIRALPLSQKQEAFFRYWTCKEAYLKTTGDGLAQLDRIEVSLMPGEPVSLVSIAGSLQIAQGWVLQKLTLASNYVAALAVAGQGWHLNCWQFI